MSQSNIKNTSDMKLHYQFPATNAPKYQKYYLVHNSYFFLLKSKCHSKMFYFENVTLALMQHLICTVTNNSSYYINIGFKVAYLPVLEV